MGRRASDLVSYTVYPGEYDPAPGRGFRPTMVGLSFAPTPCLTASDLLRLTKTLQDIAEAMVEQDEKIIKKMVQ